MSSAEQYKSNRKTKLLIVDDNSNNLKVLAGLLSKNYSLSFANNGLKAIDICKKLDPDLILLDVMMPEMDGLTVCRILKSNPETANIPVIFLTAKVEDEDIIEGFNAGGVDYIKKPFNLQELQVRINTHIELKLSKEHIINQNETLEGLNSTKDKFFSIIAHDLKNPLAAIREMSAVLFDEYDELSKDEKKELLGDLKSASANIYELLENLLTWSRSQRNLMEFNPVQTPLKLIADNVIGILGLHASNKSITLTNQVKDDHIIFADPNLITTVIRNLVSNAIKFTPEKGTITITSETADLYTNISVIDDGIGMEQKQVQSLFKIDSTRSTPGTNQEKGTGLGLILCKDFVEMHNGKIWVESELGKGSSFIFSIPNENV